jgi:hypothetical protein
MGFGGYNNMGPQMWQQSGMHSNGMFNNLTVVDTVPQEMLHLVDKHWYQFAPMNPLWHG